MATISWFARKTWDATKGGWVAGNATQQGGPVAIISANLSPFSASGDVTAKTPTTLTASATINDSTGNPVPSGLTVLVIRNDTKQKVAEITTGLNGAVSYTNTMVPPHPDYIFVLPQQPNWTTETLCSAPVTPV